MLRGDWWNGKRWRPHDELPGTPAEGREYKTALDVLAELTNAMIGDSDEPDSPERMRAATRFVRSHEADRDERSASTVAEIEADQIFEKAKPWLRKKPPFRSGFTSQPASRTAWTALACYLSALPEFGREITPNQLRMICRQRGAK
jgi:hypothetical protein